MFKLKKSKNNFLQIHLYELKINILITCLSFLLFFLTSYCFFNQLIYLLIKIFINKYILKYFIFTNITEMFSTNILISIYVSSFFIMPLLFFQYWLFILKGCFQSENFIIFKIYISYIILNFINLFIILFKIIPYIWYYFININNNTNNFLFAIYFEPNIYNYISFVFSTFFFIYFIFIYISVFIYISISHFSNITQIIRLRKFFYLKFIIISIIISPPDFYNQIIILFLFLFLFELFIFIFIFLMKYFLNK